MRRKVIQIAGSTQMVSLPRKWSLRNGIKKGAELEIEEQGPNLIVRSGSPGELKKKVLDLEEIDPYLDYVLHALYKSGYSEVVFKYKGEKSAERIQKILREEVIGFEIVEQTMNSCVVRAVAGALASEFGTMFRRSFNIVISMYDGMLEVIDTGNILPIKSLIYMESTNSKYTSFCKRMINKKDIVMDKVTSLYSIIASIELLASEQKYLCYELMRLPNQVKGMKKSIRKLFHEAGSLMKDTQDLFERYDIRKVFANMDLRREIVRKAYESIRIAKGADMRFIHYVITIVHQLMHINKAKMEMEI